MEFLIEKVFFFLILAFRENGQNSTAVEPSRDGNDDPSSSDSVSEKKSVRHRGYNSFFEPSKATIAAVWRLIYPYISGKFCIMHLL